MAGGADWTGLDLSEALSGRSDTKVYGLLASRLGDPALSQRHSDSVSGSQGSHDNKVARAPETKAEGNKNAQLEDLESERFVARRFVTQTPFITRVTNSVKSDVPTRFVNARVCVHFSA